MQQWQRQRESGAFRLTGITDITQLPAGARFLDGVVHVIRLRAPAELVVLGDLHGCYSCLQGALLQSGFIERAWAHQWNRRRNRPARYCCHHARAVGAAPRAEPDFFVAIFSTCRDCSERQQIKPTAGCDRWLDRRACGPRVIRSFEISAHVRSQCSPRL